MIVQSRDAKKRFSQRGGDDLFHGASIHTSAAERGPGTRSSESFGFRDSPRQKPIRHPRTRAAPSNVGKICRNEAKTSFINDDLQPQHRGLECHLSRSPRNRFTLRLGRQPSHPRFVTIRRHRIDQRPIFVRRRRRRRRIFDRIRLSRLLHRRLAGLGRIAVGLFNGFFCHAFQPIHPTIRSLQRARIHDDVII